MSAPRLPECTDTERRVLVSSVLSYAFPNRTCRYPGAGNPWSVVTGFRKLQNEPNDENLLAFTVFHSQTRAFSPYKCGSARALPHGRASDEQRSRMTVKHHQLIILDEYGHVRAQNDASSTNDQSLLAGDAGDEASCRSSSPCLSWRRQRRYRGLSGTTHHQLA